MVRKLLFVSTLSFLCCVGAAVGQNTKDWTPWAPVQGDWVEFQAVVDFYGEERPPEELVKADPKSLKTKVLIGGRMKGDLPSDLAGVKRFKIAYDAYGKFESSDGFFESVSEVIYSKTGQHIRPVTIVRRASEFDIAEAAKPLSEVTVSTPTPGVLIPLGVGPGEMRRKIAGRVYRIQSEWRRKGDIVEIRLKDYRKS